MSPATEPETGSPPGRHRPPDEPTDSPTSAPSPNPVEVATIGALRRLGVEAEPAEYSYKGAVLWATWPSGAELHLTARPPLPTPGDYTVTGSRRVDGILVQDVVYKGGAPRQRFVCEPPVAGGELVYEIGGSPGPRYASMGDLLEALVSEVCQR